MFKIKILSLMVISMFLLATNGCPLSPAPVSKTGQTISYANGDDGEYQKGVAWPNPRFTDNEDGTVTDKLTGLIWLKDANCFGQRTWNNALSDCNGLASGTCGLTDGSNAGEWRLPNLFELESLRNMKYHHLVLSNTAGNGQWSEGDPFNNVQGYYYWSATSYANEPEPSLAWCVAMTDGFLYYIDKQNDFNLYVWPVRGCH